MLGEDGGMAVSVQCRSGTSLKIVAHRRFVAGAATYSNSNDVSSVDARGGRGNGG
jgi:hypothetical protein